MPGEATLKRNFVVGLFGSFVGFGLLLMALSVVSAVGAQSAEVQSSASRANEVSAATPLTSTFTYEGQLKNSGSLITAAAVFQLRPALHAGAWPKLTPDQQPALKVELTTHIYATAFQVIAWIEAIRQVVYELSAAQKLLKRLGFTYKKNRLDVRISFPISIVTILWGLFWRENDRHPSIGRARRSRDLDGL